MGILLPRRSTERCFAWSTRSWGSPCCWCLWLTLGTWWLTGWGTVTAVCAAGGAGSNGEIRNSPRTLRGRGKWLASTLTRSGKKGKYTRLYFCATCVVFWPVVSFERLLFIHASTNATDDHKYSPFPSQIFTVLVQFIPFILEGKCPFWPWEGFLIG